MTEKEERSLAVDVVNTASYEMKEKAETEGQGKSEKESVKAGHEARRREVDLLRIDYQNDEIGDGERGGRRRSFVAVY